MLVFACPRPDEMEVCVEQDEVTPPYLEPAVSTLLLGPPPDCSSNCITITSTQPSPQHSSLSPRARRRERVRLANRTTAETGLCFGSQLLHLKHSDEGFYLGSF